MKAGSSPGATAGPWHPFHPELCADSPLPSFQELAQTMGLFTVTKLVIKLALTLNIGFITLASQSCCIWLVSLYFYKDNRFILHDFQTIRRI